jgi:hypothetical protein
MPKVRLTKGGVFTTAGQVLDVPKIEAERLVKQKRGELVPEHARAEKMVPQRPVERMKKR